MLKVSFGNLKKSADYNFRMELLFYLHQAGQNRPVTPILSMDEKKLGKKLVT